MDGIWFFGLGLFAGTVLGWIAASFPMLPSIKRKFAAHDAEIARRNAELDERIKGGCRQKIEPKQ